MNDLKAIFELDFKSLILAIATIIIGFNVFKKALMEFFGWMGIETKWMRDRREQKEDLEELKGHTKEQDDKIGMLMNGIQRLEISVEKISNQVEEIKAAEMETRRNTLRDRIGQSYRYYSQKKQWNAMEKEAFDGLIKSYEQAGGVNGLVHSKIIPETIEWTIIDE